MEIKQNLSIHNRYDVQVCDAATGEVKQTAVGYNVITDAFINKLLTETIYYHTTFYNLAFGSGTGTATAADTALFSEIARITPTKLEAVYAYPTSHISYRITLAADQYVGSTITEVGVISRFMTASSSDILSSHALLQDSEGQTIAIQKTDTDVVYITVTFYCSYTPGGFGNNGVYPRADRNLLIKWVFGEAWKGDSAYNTLQLRASPLVLPYSSDLEERYTFTKDFSIYYTSRGVPGIAVGNTTNKTFTLNSLSMLTEEGGTQAIRTIGIPGVGAFVFPDVSVMDHYDVNNRTIGTGDGSTTDFNLGVPFIKANTVQVFVNDTEQTEGTDYTIDYSANDTDNYGNYYSAQLGLAFTPAQCLFGDAAERTPEHSIYTCDPFSMGILTNNYMTMPRSAEVTQSKPVWMDFLSAKTCNTLKLVNNTLTDAKLDTLVLEYSSDNENWTAVSMTRTGQVFKFSEISARYWRLYCPNFTWLHWFDRDRSTMDGIANVGACVFLGKTNPALHFTTPPANGSIITASLDLDVPYKTVNNLIRMTIVIALNRN